MPPRMTRPAARPVHTLKARCRWLVVGVAILACAPVMAWADAPSGEAQTRVASLLDGINAITTDSGIGRVKQIRWKTERGCKASTNAPETMFKREPTGLTPVVADTAACGAVSEIHLTFSDGGSMDYDRSKTGFYLGLTYRSPVTSLLEVLSITATSDDARDAKMSFTEPGMHDVHDRFSGVMRRIVAYLRDSTSQSTQPVLAANSQPGVRDSEGPPLRILPPETVPASPEAAWAEVLRLRKAQYDIPSDAPPADHVKADDAYNEALHSLGYYAASHGVLAAEEHIEKIIDPFNLYGFFSSKPSFHSDPPFPGHDATPLAWHDWAEKAEGAELWHFRHAAAAGSARARLALAYAALPIRVSMSNYFYVPRDRDCVGPTSLPEKDGKVDFRSHFTHGGFAYVLDRSAAASQPILRACFLRVAQHLADAEQAAGQDAAMQADIAALKGEVLLQLSNHFPTLRGGEAVPDIATGPAILAAAFNLDADGADRAGRALLRQASDGENHEASYLLRRIDPVFDAQLTQAEHAKVAAEEAEKQHQLDLQKQQAAAALAAKQQKWAAYHSEVTADFAGVRLGMTMTEAIAALKRQGYARAYPWMATDSEETVDGATYITHNIRDNSLGTLITRASSGVTFERTDAQGLEYSVILRTSWVLTESVDAWLRDSRVVEIAARIKFPHVAPGDSLLDFGKKRYPEADPKDTYSRIGVQLGVDSELGSEQNNVLTIGIRDEDFADFVNRRVLEQNPGKKVHTAKPQF